MVNAAGLDAVFDHDGRANRRRREDIQHRRQIGEAPAAAGVELEQRHGILTPVAVQVAKRHERIERCTAMVSASLVSV